MSGPRFLHLREALPSVALELTPLALVERLAAMTPPPRKNQILYRGVLAPRSAWRKQVVPAPRPRGNPTDRRRMLYLPTEPSQPQPHPRCANEFAPSS